MSIFGKDHYKMRTKITQLCAVFMSIRLKIIMGERGTFSRIMNEKSIIY